MSEYFRLVEDGLEVRFAPEEVLFLSDILRVLGSLGASDDDPGAARLNPPAYLGDIDADQEWHRFTDTELSAARRADRSALELVVESFSDRAEEEGPVVVSLPEAQAIMRVINDARLVLGARWGVDTADDYSSLRPESADILSFLGWLVSDLAIVLGGALGRA